MPPLLTETSRAAVKCLSTFESHVIAHAEHVFANTECIASAVVEHLEIAMVVESLGMASVALAIVCCIGIRGLAKSSFSRLLTRLQKSTALTGRDNLTGKPFSRIRLSISSTS